MLDEPATPSLTQINRSLGIGGIGSHYPKKRREMKRALRPDLLELGFRQPPSCFPIHQRSVLNGHFGIAKTLKVSAKIELRRGNGFVPALHRFRRSWGTISSVFWAASRSIHAPRFSSGCLRSNSLAIITPSLQTSSAPHFLSIKTDLERGPSVTRTASAHWIGPAGIFSRAAERKRIFLCGIGGPRRDPKWDISAPRPRPNSASSGLPSFGACREAVHPSKPQTQRLGAAARLAGEPQQSLLHRCLVGRSA